MKYCCLELKSNPKKEQYPFVSSYCSVVSLTQEIVLTKRQQGQNAELIGYNQSAF
jgi:hypothetical protein